MRVGKYIHRHDYSAQYFWTVARASGALRASATLSCANINTVFRGLHRLNDVLYWRMARPLVRAFK